MCNKYKIVKLSDDSSVDFYGAEIGDLIEIKTGFDEFGNVWAKGSDVFKEEGWTNLAQYCIADDMASLLKYVEKV